MFRSLCRSSQLKSLPKQTQSVRLYAGGHGHDSHGHGHGHEDAHGHGHGDHHHGPVPLELKEWAPVHLQESGALTTDVKDTVKQLDVNSALEEKAATLLEESGSLDYFLKTYNSLTAEESDGEDWLTQVLSNKTVLEALAQINTTELSFSFKKLNSKDLLAKYAEELATFESKVLPQLQKEGVSTRIISHLHYLYKLRPRVHPTTIDSVLEKFQILAIRWPSAKDSRVVTGTRTAFPFNLFQLSRVGYEAWTTPFESDKVLEERNVKNLIGWKAISDAFARGFTDQEYDHVSKFLNKLSIPTEVLNALNAEAAEIKYLRENDKKKAEEKVSQMLAKYPNGSKERGYIIDYLTEEETASVAIVDGLYEKSPLVVPYPSKTAGETPFNQAAIESALDAGISAESKNSTNVTVLAQVKQAVGEIFSQTKPKDIDILDKLRSAELDHSKLDELFAPFLKDYKLNLDEKLLSDALNPNPIAAKLWGDTLLLRSTEQVQYNREFADVLGGTTTNFDSPKVQEALGANTDKGKYEFLPETAPIITGFDDLYHHKLVRLAQDYYNIDLKSDVGQIQFDLFMHAYDISPGEDTLERVQAFPMPEHTYDELPVIKFDGYEESDDPEIHALAKKEQKH